MESTNPLPHLPTLSRCLVMGIVNVTPDSFSDGGQWDDTHAAVERGRQLAAEGADIIDVGGESTRPGADRVSVEEELRRVHPVVGELARQGIVTSVDTMRAEVAEAAVAAGARIVNDVSGGLADPAMADVVARSGVGYVVSHWRGHSRGMQDQASYTDVVTDVVTELETRMTELRDSGVHPEQMVLDPGLGFAKSVAEGHNWSLLAGIQELRRLGRPVLVGASRKRFLGHLLRASDEELRPAPGRDDATVALTALAAYHGAWAVRVHEVSGNADAVRVADAWRGAADGMPAATTGGGAW
ncbi:dihydropteroate synthase [Lipingzhangella sp. LS1_29]|uniref:Dihydropteroate synthase n=1 Tax=Lipingzhangella rawalii TaxID=2055835 RepID=A0ABU2H9C4_9ACTN|nr:dihydropteroate synthase [Lipingzhangella rawalii]MDS1271916.1 dihydropteroate synthase [Lipingzhangella rawalii]